MKFWSRKKKRRQEVEAIFRKMEAAVFPGGERQISLETDKLVSLLGGTMSLEHMKRTLIHAKGRAFLALNSAENRKEVVDRCTESIYARSQGKLDRATAEKIATFAVDRLLEQDSIASMQDTTISLPELTKEEAIEIARITAFRLARHQGRTDVSLQQAYNTDPVMCITTVMAHFLISGRKNDAPKKIETQQDAVELSLDVIQTLVLIDFMEKFGEQSILAPQELHRLTKLELECTLDLIRNKKVVKQYSGYDASEARAAHNMQVPFDIALTLGEIGLLKDPPGPTDARRKKITDMMQRQ